MDRDEILDGGLRYCDARNSLRRRRQRGKERERQVSDSVAKFGPVRPVPGINRVEGSKGTSDKGNAIAMFGRARGTFAVDGKLARENFWEIPAAWRAVVKDGRVAEWRVYCDNDPARKIMAANTPAKLKS